MTSLPANISSIATTLNPAPKSKSQSDLGTTDFLRLMTEQLKQQDPFAPNDNTQMVAQMAQMASSSGIKDINTTLKNISTQLADQTALLKSLTARPTT